MNSNKRSTYQNELKQIGSRLALLRKQKRERTVLYTANVTKEMRKCDADCAVIQRREDELGDRRAVVLAKLNAEEISLTKKR